LVKLLTPTVAASDTLLRLSATVRLNFRTEELFDCHALTYETDQGFQNLCCRTMQSASYFGPRLISIAYHITWTYYIPHKTL